MSSYHLLVAPHLYLIDPGLEETLLAWVEAGGHLLLGARSGWADLDGARRTDGQPGGRLQTALGAHVAEYFALGESLTVTCPRSGDGRAKIWAEWLEPEAHDACVLARYGAGHGWLEGRPAWVERPFGRGRIGHLGFWPEPDLWTAIAKVLADQAGIALPWHPLPAGVEVSTRRGPAGWAHLISNHASAAVQVRLPGTLRILPEGPMVDTVAVPAGGTAVVGKTVENDRP